MIVPNNKVYLIRCSRTLPYSYKNDKGRMTNVETFERTANETDIVELKRTYRVRKLKEALS